MRELNQRTFILSCMSHDVSTIRQRCQQKWIIFLSLRLHLCKKLLCQRPRFYLNYVILLM